MIEGAKEFYNKNAMAAFTYASAAGFIAAAETVLPLARAGLQMWIALALVVALFAVFSFMLFYAEISVQNLKKLLIWLAAIFIFALMALVIL